MARKQWFGLVNGGDERFEKEIIDEIKSLCIRPFCIKEFANDFVPLLVNV